MFLLILLSVLVPFCAANCVSNNTSAIVTGQGDFNINISNNTSECNANSYIFVNFECGKTLSFKKQLPSSSTNSPLKFTCDDFNRLTLDPNLICDFYQCLNKNGTKAVKAIYMKTSPQNSAMRLLKDTTTEQTTLTLNITTTLVPPPDQNAKDSNLLTIIIIVIVVVVVLIIVFVVFCVLCNKKKTQANIDAAQKVDAMYREHPKNELLIDIIKRQKRYEDSENTDDFYANIADTGPVTVASARGKSSRTTRLSSARGDKTRRIESEDDLITIEHGKRRSSTRMSFHDESFTVNRVLKPTTGDLNLTDSDK